VQIGEPVGTPSVSPPEKPPETFKCDWSKCKSDHLEKLKYPEGGNVSREGGLRGLLEGKELQPWKSGGHGISTKPIFFENGKIKKSADGSNFTEYRIQAHHLIPVDELQRTGTLKSNAILAGWDIDALENGMFLPRDKMDIAIHELQQHSGSHCGKYTAPIRELLREIEKDSEKACHGMNSTNLQVSLVKDELEALSAEARDRILAIRGQQPGQFWELHNNSLVTFTSVLIEYARRKALNVIQGP